MSATEISLSSARRQERPLMAMDMAEWDLDAATTDDALLHRMRRWAGEAHWQLLAHHRGRIVKQTDSGLLMEFADARSCLQAAFALGRLADAASPRAIDSKRLRLRTGAHLAKYGRDQDELVGRDVKLTSQLTTLAKPGEVLVSAELRDRLVDGLDADLEDLGYQSVKAFAQPVRLFRAHPGHGDSSNRLMVASRDLRPGLAVIPFKSSDPEAKRRMIGELIAEGVIARLSHSVAFRVISRQSTSAFRDSDGLGEIERHLGATFVLSGNYDMHGKKLVVSAELAEARSHTLLWSGRLQQSVDDLLQEESELLHELARTVAYALGKAQVRKAWTRPLPRLDSSLLMLAGISMVHSHSTRTFGRGREALKELIARHPKLAQPRAWLAMWHALNVVKGTSGNVAHDSRQAREQALRALHTEPRNAMALAVEGYIQCQLLGNPQQAQNYLKSAIEANPSEPMAWLFKSFSSAMWGPASISVTEAYFARSLSPVDPMGYFFDLLTGNALLANDQHEQAIACARRSLRAKRQHVPTLRLLLTAQAELGMIDEGKETLRKLLSEMPDLTVSSYLEMGSAGSPMRQRTASAMRQLGLPED